MKVPVSMYRGGIVLLIFALTSCGGGKADVPAVQTVVAETFQALTANAPELAPTSESAPILLSTPTAESLPSPLPTSAQPTTPEPNVTFEGISFYLNYQLANSWSYEITPLPDPTSDNPFQQPSQYRLQFEGFVGADAVFHDDWRTPRLYVIPVANMQSFPGGGYGLDVLAQLQQILTTKPAKLSENMPILPFNVNFDNGEAFHSNVNYVNFKNGAGVRFLAQFAQFPNTIGHRASYIFEGLTNDGKYYVCMTLPISQTALDQYNAPYDTVNSDPVASKAFWDNFESYLVGAIAILEETPNSSFTPDLSQLDALVQSLSVKP